MSKLLYIQASPRVERSHSRAVTDAFVEAYRQEHPNDQVITLDLFQVDLPTFDNMAARGKYSIMHGEKEIPAEAKAAWKQVEKVISEFVSADRYVFAVPMWNFGIPYRLKHYIDLVWQPGYTFTVTPDGNYQGMVVNKPALVVYARGGNYPEGSDLASQLDFQKRYMELALGFIGFTRIHAVMVQPTLQGGPEMAARVQSEAIAAALELLPSF